MGVRECHDPRQSRYRGSLTFFLYSSNLTALPMYEHQTAVELRLPSAEVKAASRSETPFAQLSHVA